MSNQLEIVNWERWQSYRADRGQPPWIKIHRRLLRNMDWIRLSDAERGQLTAMWMLAADNNGLIPAQAETIAKLCFMTEFPEVSKFIELGWLTPSRRQADATLTPTRRQADAKLTPSRRQRDAPEENRVEENRERGLASTRRQADANVTPERRQGDATANAEALAPEKDTHGKGKRLPETWSLSPVLHEWATTDFPDADLDREEEMFIDYFKAAPGAKGLRLDWDSTFRNWMRRGGQFERHQSD